MIGLLTTLILTLLVVTMCFYLTRLTKLNNDMKNRKILTIVEVTLLIEIVLLALAGSFI